MGIDQLNTIVSMAYSTVNTVQNTYKLSKEVRHLNGCLVECGVGAGAQLMVMALTDQRVYGFDSFEGIPMAGIYDDQQPGIGAITHDTKAPLKHRLKSSGVTVHSIQNVRSNFEQAGVCMAKVTLVPGWFSNTLPVYDTGPIKLLRLDGDLYESTFVCLQYLYEKVVSGGVIIIDDYALPGCAKAVKDYFFKLPELIEVEGSGGVVYFYKK